MGRRRHPTWDERVNRAVRDNEGKIEVSPILAHNARRGSWDDLPTLAHADLCRELSADLGEEPAEHFDPRDYTPAELEEMGRYSVCPLHKHPDYPDVPEGRWKQAAEPLFDELEALTVDHLGRKRKRTEPLMVTAAELASIRERYTFLHTRDLLEKMLADDANGWRIELVDA